MQDAKPTVLVTGGTGFLGRAVVARLLESGARVRLYSRSPPTPEHDAVEWTPGCVLDAPTLASAAVGADAIIHLAGRVSHTRRGGYTTLRELHVDGAINAVDAARLTRRRRLVVASTSGTVAVSELPVRHDDRAVHAHGRVRRWPYYLTKIEAELAAVDRAAAVDVGLVLLRPSLLLGPGDDRRASTGVVEDFLRGRVPFVPPGGINFADVRDVAAAFVAAVSHPSPADAYLVGAHDMTVAELFLRLQAVSGVRAPALRAPAGAMRAAARLAPLFERFGGAAGSLPDPVVAEMSTHYWYVDAARARADLGFQPRSADATLHDTVEWLRSARP